MWRIYGVERKYWRKALSEGSPLNVCVVHVCVCVCVCVCVHPGGVWMICALSDTWNAQNVRDGEEKRGPLWPRPWRQVTLQWLVGPWRSECSRGPVTPLKKGRRSTSTGAPLSSPRPAGFFQLRREPRSQNETFLLQEFFKLYCRNPPDLSQLPLFWLHAAICAHTSRI